MVVLNDLAAMTTYLVITRLVGFVGASFANPIARKFGKKQAYLGSNLLMVAGLALCFFFGRNLWGFIVLQIVVNFFMQITMPCLTAILADTVIYYEWKTSKDARGFIMSMLNVPIKVGAVLRSVILGVGLSAAGYVAGAAATPEMVTGIAALMNLYPAVFLILTVLIFALGYRLSDKRVAEMTAEIEQRKAV